MATIDRRAYAEIFGPTVGDRVRLADTDLLLEVEKDYTLSAGSYGEEVKFGGGKTIRDGMAQSQRTRSDGAVDVGALFDRREVSDLERLGKRRRVGRAGGRREGKRGGTGKGGDPVGAILNQFC